MYLEVMGEEKYKAALAGRDEMEKYYFRLKKEKEE